MLFDKHFLQHGLTYVKGVVVKSKKELKKSAQNRATTCCSEVCIFTLIIQFNMNVALYQSFDVNICFISVM